MHPAVLMPEQAHYIPSLILSWAVNLVKVKNGKRVSHEAPIFLRGIYLRWVGRKVRIPSFRQRRD